MAGLEHPVIEGAGHFLQEDAGERLGGMIADFVRTHPVLISPDGVRWGWPGGRPEPGESWEQTLRREIAEKACATVIEARLLGFVRSRCTSGHEEGLVLVRSIWRAEVTVLPWRPAHEIPFRRMVTPDELAGQLWMEPGAEPIYARAAREAGLALPLGMVR